MHKDLFWRTENLSNVHSYFYILKITILNLDRLKENLAAGDLHITLYKTNPLPSHLWEEIIHMGITCTVLQEKHLWILFDKLITKWAISLQGFWIALGKEGAI